MDIVIPILIYFDKISVWLSLVICLVQKGKKSEWVWKLAFFLNVSKKTLELVQGGFEHFNEIKCKICFTLKGSVSEKLKGYRLTSKRINLIS